MHIKSITIDGFKSYGQRVDINGFDHLFNAITGLNGSGKSNILDSICFVLGITNLSQVRAANLQDLVYKNGQAGVTKATVSITFDNRDPKQRPVGYEHYDEFTITRQVVVGGRNKYLINGVTATTNRVQDLFRSVQLNVNNPHFLIMQGRITKVLNMKPPEYLLESTALLTTVEIRHHRYIFTNKKARTGKQKKEKLVLAEEITPTIEKLKEERQAYLAYTKVSRELDHLTKLYIAWQYMETEKAGQTSVKKLDEMKAKISGSHATIEEIAAKTKDIGKEIAELERKKKEETGDRLEALEKDLKEKQLEEAKVNSTIKITKDKIKGEAKNKAGFKKNMDEDNAALVSKQKQAEKLQATLGALEESSQRDAEAVAAANKHFRAVTAGLSSNADGEEATITEQLRAAKSDIAESATAMRQAEMDLKHFQEESKKKQAECRKTESSYQKDEAANKAIEKDINTLKAQMSKLNYEEGKEEALLSQKQQLQRDVNALRQKVDVFEARNQHLSFHYSDPVKNFDRRKVLGLVCDLFTVKDKRAARALETAAGGKVAYFTIKNAIKDRESQTHRWRHRTQPNGMKQQMALVSQSRAMFHCSLSEFFIYVCCTQVGQDKVFSAISLVDYAPAVASAMKFVFGTTLVTTNMDDARVVAYDKGVQKRTVSFDGACFDPSGVISGGAVARGPSTLEQVALIQQDRKALADASASAANVTKELAGIQNVSHKYNKLKAEFELKETELEQLRSRLQQSTHHQLLQEFNALQKSIEESKAKLASCKEVEKRATAKVKDLEEKVKDAKNIRERELKAAEQQITQCKKKADESAKKFTQKKQEAEGIQLEIEELQKCLAGYKTQLECSDDNLQAMERALAETQQKLADIKEQVSKANAELTAQKEKLKAASREIGAKYAERDELQKKADDLKLKIQQWKHDISKIEKEASDAEQKLKDLVNHYEWIPSEKQYFGQPNTEYDFAVNNPVEAGRRIQKLTETKEKLGQNVNSRAQNQLLKAEEKYQDLNQKKRTVLADKAKIMTVIEELDRKKSLALEAAWEKVNKDFGSIFSTLLPGTNAKLAPLDGNVLDGLEVKVAFGGVWKESLQELSGGQRSLVALSLILSLLLFNPAPIYILDEVDAALDLSHTQNIGQMLRTHFKQSQFIVVSLKEGMFNNANVLFRTKCVNGMSSVTRTAQTLEMRK
ncbi:unnamed protein product [Ixodes hexagonus]